MELSLGYVGEAACVSMFMRIFIDEVQGCQTSSVYEMGNIGVGVIRMVQKAVIQQRGIVKVDFQIWRPPL